MTVVISVVGEHTIDSPPERAVLFVTASFETDDKHRTVESTTRLVRELTGELESLTAEGGPATWFSVGPMRTHAWRPHAESGAIMPLRHVASVPVQVKFRDFGQLAAFSARFGRRTGVRLDRVEWRLTQVTERGVKEAALAGAVANARARALVMARAAGFTDVTASQLADPGLLEGTPGDGPPAPFAKAEVRRAAADSGAADLDPEAIDLKPEDVSISATVHARFTAR